jgi:hypothetical protein
MEHAVIGPHDNDFGPVIIGFIKVARAIESLVLKEARWRSYNYGIRVKDVPEVLIPNESN